MIDLSKLEELARAATPGPWEQALYVRTDQPDTKIIAGNDHVTDCDGYSASSEQDLSNAAYIVAANPATMLDLIALIRKQEVGLAAARAESANSGTFPGAATGKESLQVAPSVTVDTPEFFGRLMCCILAPDDEKDREITGLITHIDAHVAQAVAREVEFVDNMTPDYVALAAKLDECKRENAALRAAQPGDGELPDLPEPVCLGGDEAFGDQVYGYTADQMRDYGRRCLAARQPVPVASQGSLRTENPPEFYKYNPDGVEGMGDRAALWAYGQLVGWRIGYPQGRSDGLEEAAKECDAQAGEPECPERAQYCAEAVRALNKTGGA